MTKSSNKFNIFILCLLIIITLTPKLSAMFPAYIILGLVFVWIINSLFRVNLCVQKESCILISFLLLFIVFLYKIIGISSAEWGNYCITFYFFSGFWIFLHTERYYKPYEKKKLAYIVLIVMFANVLTNIYMAMNIENFTAWSYVGASKITEYVTQYNLGSTNFTTTALLFSGITISLFLFDKGKRRLLWLLFSLTAMIYLVLYAGRASNLILLIVMIILFCIYRNDKISTIAPILIGIGLLFFIFFGDALLDWMAEFIPSERIAVRIKAISFFLQGSSEGDLYMSRLEIVLMDFSTWTRSISSFIFGIGDHRYLNGNLNEIYSIGISGHSAYFDFLPQYGLIGFSLLNLLFFSFSKKIELINITSYKWKRYAKIIFLIVILRSLIGSIFSSDVTTMLFIGLPCSAYLLFDDSGENECIVE